MLAKKDCIALLPVGNVPFDILGLVRESLNKSFDKPLEILRPVPVPQQAFNPTRRQYHSSTILKLIQKTMGGRFERILAVTDVDLFVPQLNFVFGEADVLNGNAVISLARLRPQFYGLPGHEQLVRDRILKESNHEIGHTYNLSHCENPQCVMFFSNTIQDTDSKLREFCKECAKMLEEHKGAAVKTA
jgi:archaemetzincin